MSQESRENRQRAVVLDPYGIYGTRTAQRLRNMRRRRHVQQLVLTLVLLGLLAVGIYSRRSHRIPTLQATGSWRLWVVPAAAPLWDARHRTLLIPTRDGQIVAVWPHARPLRSAIWLEADFPLSTSPILGEKYFYTASENGMLYAIDRARGKVAWKYDSGASISTQPKLLGTLLFCGNSEGWLTALRPNDGTVVWRRKLPSAIGDGFEVITAPQKLVFVPLAGNAAQRGGVWALDVNNGEVKWKFPLDPQAHAEQIAAPVAALVDWQTRLFCANDTGALVNLQATTGQYTGSAAGWKTLFASTSGGDEQLLFRQPPLIDTQAQRPRLFICGNDNSVRAIDIRTSRTLWQWQAPAPVLQVEPLGKNHLLVVCESEVSYLLTRNNGEVDTVLTGKSAPFQAFADDGAALWSLDAAGTLRRFAVSNHYRSH